MTEFSDFVEKNSGFILTFIGILGGGCSYLLVFCLKSRCSVVKCCGVEITRIPLPPEQLDRVNLELPNSVT